MFHPVQTPVWPGFLHAMASKIEVSGSFRPEAVGEQRLLHVRLSIHRFGSCVTVGF